MRRPRRCRTASPCSIGWRTVSIHPGPDRRRRPRGSRCRRRRSSQSCTATWKQSRRSGCSLVRCDWVHEARRRRRRSSPSCRSRRGRVSVLGGLFASIHTSAALSARWRLAGCRGRHRSRPAFADRVAPRPGSRASETTHAGDRQPERRSATGSIDGHGDRAWRSRRRTQLAEQTHGVAARAPAGGLDRSRRRAATTRALERCAPALDVADVAAPRSARRGTRPPRGPPSTAPVSSLIAAAGARGERGARPLPRAAPVQHPRHRDGRSHRDRVGNRGAEAPLPPRHRHATRRSGASCSASRAPGPTSPALATRAVRDGDEWVVNGQKVWTTLGPRREVRDARRPHRSRPAEAPRAHLLHRRHARARRRGAAARADHRRRRVQRGVLHRRARARLDCGSGPRARDGGSRITTLMNERVSLSGAGSAGGDAVGGSPVARLIERHRPVARPPDPTAVGAGVDRRSPDPAQQPARRRPPAHRRRGRARGFDHQAPAGDVQPAPAEARGRSRGRRTAARGRAPGSDACTGRQTFDPAAGEGHLDVARGFLRAQANTIEGGTSDIMRNILGERVLGLPKEPDASRDLPWKDVPRSTCAVSAGSGSRRAADGR